MKTKSEYMKTILETIQSNGMIVVAGVGSGITAKGAQSGGADILATYNTAVYRIQGLPTAMAFLPYDDCNALAFAAMPQVVAVAGDTPVMVGIGAHDPRKDLAKMVEQAHSNGAAGVTNEPFIGMYEGDLRRQMEAAGLGFSRETELIRAASKADMLTLAYVFTPEEAVEMAYAGADLICVMVGGVTSGGIAGGAETVGLSEAVETVNRITDALKRAGRACPVLVHGGPLNDVAPVQQVLNQTEAVGYVTGSTGERVPTEMAVRDKISSFKSIRKEKLI